MNITTKLILNALPLDAETRALANRYPDLPEKEKSALGEMAWDTYYKLFDSYERAELQIAQEEIVDGNREFVPGMGKVIHDHVEKKLDQFFQNQSEEHDLNAIRAILTKIDVKNHKGD